MRHRKGDYIGGGREGGKVWDKRFYEEIKTRIKET